MIRFYAKRLERDLKRWLEKGWLSEEGYRAILAEQSREGLPATAALAAIGAVLVAFAAISFVAANWETIARLYRVAILLAALWAAYGGAAYLFERGLPAFAHAAVLVGAAVFGAVIMLVSQMYHIDGHPPDFVILWAAGALLAGVAFRSSLTLSFAVLLIGIWSFSEEALLDRQVHWLFLPVWAGAAGSIVWNRSGVGMHVAAAVFAAWLIGIGYVLPSNPHGVIAILGAGSVLAAAAVIAIAPMASARQIAARIIPYGIIVTFAGFIALAVTDQNSNAPIIAAALGVAGCAGVMLTEPSSRLQQIRPILFAYALAVALLGFFIIQFHWEIPIIPMVITAALTLIVLAGAVVYGMRISSRLVTSLTYIGLIFEILSLYFKTIGSLINTSLFFLLTGLLITAFAIMSVRYRGRSKEREAGR